MLDKNYKVGGISSLILNQNRKRKIEKGRDLVKNTEKEELIATKIFKNCDTKNDVETILSKGIDEIVVKKKLTKPVEKKKLTGRQVAKKRKKEMQETQSRTVFIGNVPANLKIVKIKKLFNEFGSIEQIYERSRLLKNQKLTLKMIGTNKKLQKNLTTKVIFVRYETENAAQAAVEKMNGCLVNENNLRVTLSSKTKMEAKNSIFVGNIAFEAEEQKLYDFFQKNCGEVDMVRIISDKTTGKNTGIGYVSFKDKASVLLALNLNESEFYGRPLRISKILKKNKRSTNSNKNFNKKQKQTLSKTKTLHKITNWQKQKVENLAEKITQFSTFKKDEVIESNIKKKNIVKTKNLSKNVKKQIKKRLNSKKRKSLMN